MSKKMNVIVRAQLPTNGRRIASFTPYGSEQQGEAITVEFADPKFLKLKRKFEMKKLKRDILDLDGMINRIKTGEYGPDLSKLSKSDHKHFKRNEKIRKINSKIELASKKKELADYRKE